MDIQRAKEEIIRSVKAYLMKDELGEYLIPQVHQRPILLIGPPGIGKTAIMEQAAKECGISLLAYTITHHTRQSAVGLPFIEHREYDGREHAITEYTMSEIIASVHDRIRQTGCREGILFIDEINCVSETLAPTMLQFLQKKTFGSHPVPEGWIIAAAGNPPEYNKSVRDFDIVTLDRVRRIEVEESLPAWKKYAAEHHMHRAVLTYLELKPENFYRMETTVDGKRFVTARGWEDLSRILYVYEKLGYTVDEGLTIQYLQHPGIARDFSNYYELFRRYAGDYGIEEVLAGQISREKICRLREAPFDERISVVGLLLSALTRDLEHWDEIEQYTDALYKEVKALSRTPAAEQLPALEERTRELEAVLAMQRENRLAREGDYRLRERLRRSLEEYQAIYRQGGSYELVKNAFLAAAEEQEAVTELAGIHLERAFDFMGQAFGESQEMVLFLTELTILHAAIAYIREYGCKGYTEYIRLLQPNEEGREIREAIRSARMQE